VAHDFLTFFYYLIKSQHTVRMYCRVYGTVSVHVIMLNWVCCVGKGYWTTMAGVMRHLDPC